MSMAIKVARIQTQGSGRALPGIGDPGLFSFLGKAASTFVQAIPGPVGSIAQKLLSPTAGVTVSNGTIISSGRFQQAPQSAPPRPPGTAMVPTPGVGGALERFFPGGETGFQPAAGCATGFHPNKSDYFLKNGTFIQKGSRCVKNRRRNPLNARAADRAISRIESAKRATKRLGRITIRKTCPK